MRRGCAFCRIEALEKRLATQRKILTLLSVAVALGAAVNVLDAIVGLSP